MFRLVATSLNNDSFFRIVRILYYEWNCEAARSLLFCFDIFRSNSLIDSWCHERLSRGWSWKLKASCHENVSMENIRFGFQSYAWPMKSAKGLDQRRVHYNRTKDVKMPGNKRSFSGSKLLCQPDSSLVTEKTSDPTDASCQELEERKLNPNAKNNKVIGQSMLPPMSGCMSPSFLTTSRHALLCRFASWWVEVSISSLQRERERERESSPLQCYQKQSVADHKHCNQS